MTERQTVWAAENGMYLQSSTLKYDEGGKPFHVQQAEQMRLYKEAGKKSRTSARTKSFPDSVNFCIGKRSDHYYFGQESDRRDKIGMIEQDKRVIFGRSYAAEPDQLIKELAQDEAIQEADTVLLTIPNTLGVDYNVHVLSSILEHVAPGLGWR
ncbi:hypothetical protein [Dyadobacter fanqingshengii]|uniref:LLM class flavin-dependent oxidoreductase n=1 Tax=Dyadobacter fanqingshengii TaxID=2906443 RepID=A0A9X1T8L8_9BACT|nr:hypothetical protein [Dyadobacter fanqingshengii]MCF0039786.1 hypothetical protein [Dyadobacter fanqingshengii]USJ38451.1 hypothetical protein NFI81_11850 [Dyadobacter fanqingshengii]